MAHFQEGLSSLVDSGNFHCDKDYSKSSASVSVQDYANDEIEGVFYAKTHPLFIAESTQVR